MKLAIIIVALFILAILWLALPLSVAAIVIGICLLVFLLLMAVQLLWVRKKNPDEIANVGNFGQGIASTFTAVALVGAGVIYYYDTQWEPKVSVDIGAHAFLLRDDPKDVLIQAVVKITNQSKIDLEFARIFVNLAFIDDGGFYPTRHGDLPEVDSQNFISPRQKIVNAGETDFAYYELVAPCSYDLVRVLAKLPSSQNLRGQRLVYERKIIVPIGELCAGKVSEVHAGNIQ